MSAQARNSSISGIYFETVAAAESNEVGDYMFFDDSGKVTSQPLSIETVAGPALQQCVSGTPSKIQVLESTFIEDVIGDSSIALSDVNEDVYWDKAARILTLTAGGNLPVGKIYTVLDVATKKVVLKLAR